MRCAFQAQSGAYRMYSKFPDIRELFFYYIVCQRLNEGNNAKERLKNMGWI